MGGISRFGLGLCLCLSQTGCFSDLFDFEDGELTCSSSEAPADVGGRWLINGVGSRAGCVDERFNGGFRFEAEAPVLVQVAEDGTLTAPEAPEGFALTGSVNGRCVVLQTEESTLEGLLRFRVDGEFETGQIQGTLGGSGPAGCSVTGSVTIDVQ